MSDMFRANKEDDRLTTNEKRALIILLPLIGTFLYLSYKLSAWTFYGLLFALGLNVVGFVFFEGYKLYTRRTQNVRKQRREEKS